MDRSQCDNETQIAPRPLNDFGQAPRSANFGHHELPESLSTQHTGGVSSLMTAPNDAQGLHQLKIPVVPIEPASDLSEWSPEEREALALGLYLFKADAEKICSILGSKTVRTPIIYGHA